MAYSFPLRLLRFCTAFLPLFLTTLSSIPAPQSGWMEAMPCAMLGPTDSTRLDSTLLFSSLLLMIDLWKCDPIYTFNLVALCRKREKERERERNKEMTVKRRRERELGVLEHSSKSNLAQGSPISPSVPPCPIGALGLDWTNWLTLAQLRLIEPAPRTIDGNTERRGPYHLAFKRRYSLSRSLLRQLQGR